MANNANVNKVVYGNSVLVDLTADTVAADKLLSGTTAHSRSGAPVTGSIPSRAAQSYTPGASAQTIAAGQYLAGAQTIQGDANLTAANIAAGVSIFGVTGTHSGGAPEPDDVNFFDYDGTLVKSYSAAAFANLSAMPANPTHTGLTAQGWNWSLANAKAYVTAYGFLDIAQMYVPTDGKTHIFLNFADDTPAPHMRQYLRWDQSVSNGVTINWGDGSAAESYSGTGAASHLHAYAQPGSYEVTLEVTDGTLSFPGQAGTSASSYSIYGDHGDNNYYNRPHIVGIWLGSHIETVGDYAFWNCYALREIIIPRGVTTLGSNMLYYCHPLKFVAIPDTVTDLVGQTFQFCCDMEYVSLPRSLTILPTYTYLDCYSLKRVAIPDTVTEIGNYPFGRCYNLREVILPNSLTTIGNEVFNGCYTLQSVTWPTGLTTIPDKTFYCCTSLRNFTIPYGVTSLGSNVFYQCYSMTYYDVPETVTTMGRTFYYCYSIGAIHFHSTTPPTITEANAFAKLPSTGFIYVPYSADHSVLAAYQSATNWSTYRNKIKEEPQ